MDLYHLSDQELWAKTDEIVSQERKHTTELLWHLREISKRKLYLDRGFSSLYNYVTVGLKYTPASAMRRIKAMKLLRALPEKVQKKVEESLNTGKVSLSNVSSLQSFLEKEKKIYTPEAKQELFSKIEGKSQEECQKLFFSISTDPEKILPKEKSRVVSATETELKIIAEEKLMQNIQRLKELTAHKNSNPSYAEVFEMATEFMLNKIDPERNQEKKSERKSKVQIQAREPQVLPVQENKASQNFAAESPNSRNQNEINSKNTNAPQKAEANSNPPSEASIKRAALKRDQYRCTFKDLITGKICGCKYGLELDHIHPVALGGKSTLDNLRVRCRAHNLLEAERVFGKSVMQNYYKNE